MTPRERLGSPPPIEVLVHEAGHLSFGLVLGISEGGIEFVDGSAGKIAKAHFSLKKVTNMQIVMRTLAALHSQALICPTSITADLRNLITERALFTTADAFNSESKVTKLMRENGFAGDWDRIRNAALALFPNKTDALSRSQNAHKRMVKIFQESLLERTVGAIVKDLEAWLNTEDEDVPLWKMIVYPITRARAIYEQHLRA